MSQYIERLSGETRPSALFAKPPRIGFYPGVTVCGCGRRLLVEKSRSKMARSLKGPFIAKETVLFCPDCNRSFPPKDLLRVVPKGCNVGWDVLVFVGRGLFQKHRSTQEIQTDLQARDVTISPSEVDYLGLKFIAYLALGHRLATPRLRHAMNRKGGYVLHLDATHEADAPALMTGIDSLSRYVLANVKIPSEHADHIIPFLEKLCCDYGNPIACVHDMGRGILKAVAHVFPGVADFICHFHFLRDVGKDLLDPVYRQLRDCLRQHGVSSQLNALKRETCRILLAHERDASCLARAIAAKDRQQQMNLAPVAASYCLASWCLKAKQSGDGYGFPFDRPLLAFSERLLALMEELPDLLMLLPASGRIGNRHFFNLARKVIDIGSDPQFHPCVEELRWRSQLFDRLRKAMRIAPADEGAGLNDEGTTGEMTSIRREVTCFRKRLDADEVFAADVLCQKMAKQIDTYQEKLFADPIQVDTPSGKILVYPQRTNNMMERFFRDLRRGHRRKTGNNSMRKALQTMMADTPLVKNLDNPEYVDILLDGKATLEELFAELDMTHARKELFAKTDEDSIRPRFRKLIGLPNLPARVAHWLNQTPRRAA